MQHSNPQQQAVAQVYELLLDSNIEVAIPLADEVLADAGCELARNPGEETASAVMMCATAYAEALFKGGRPRQSVGVLLNTMNRTVQYAPAETEMMTACITLWHSIEFLLSQTSPDSALQRTAIETLCSGLATMLYGLYYAVGHTAPRHPALDDAYTTLRLLSNLVEIDTSATTSISNLIASITAAARQASLL